MASTRELPSAVFDYPFPSSRSGERYVASGPVSLLEREKGMLLGGSAAVRQLRFQIERIAPHYRIALICGDSGCGKQIVARTLHARSAGSGGAFLMASAATLAEALCTGTAHRSALPSAALSLLQSAQGGTIYLVGVSGLSYRLQAALNRFLASCEQSRANIRILVSCGRSLRTMVSVGQFRQDLYVRLTAVEIAVPALRERVEDISELAGWLLDRFADQFGESPKQLSPMSLAELKQAAWPHNLRQLRKVVAQGAALAEGSTIEPRHLVGMHEPQPVAAVARPERLEDLIQHHVLEVLTRCGGNKLRAAELLGISRSTLYRMLDAAQQRVAR